MLFEGIPKSNDSILVSMYTFSFFFRVISKNAK